jgi:hypothetical protein
MRYLTLAVLTFAVLVTIYACRPRINTTDQFLYQGDFWSGQLVPNPNYRHP